MRLVDADALPRHGRRGGLVHWKDIENAPTVDAVPLEDYKSMESTVNKLTQALADAVKHGHNTNDGVRLFRCSECGWGMNDIYMADESMVEDFDKFPYYCPYCGAKMDEVEEG